MLRNKYRSLKHKVGLPSVLKCWAKLVLKITNEISLFRETLWRNYTFFKVSVKICLEVFLYGKKWDSAFKKSS